MKVSKINHTRTGVVNENFAENTNKNGILYKNPSASDKAKKDIREHIKKANEKAKSLYNSVFGPTKVYAKDKSKFAEIDVTDIFDKAFLKKAIIENKAYSKDMLVSNIRRNIEIKVEDANKKNRKFGFNNIANLDEFVETIVNVRLRRNLRKNYKLNDKKVNIPDAVASILKAIINDTYVNISEPEYEAVYNAIKEDYTKENQIEKIADSIEKQNVKVKVADINGSKKLILSNADNKKKHYIFDFMQEFAGKDEAGQKELLIHIRSLILLFVCGKEIYNRVPDSGVLDMTFGELKPEPNENFSDEIYEKIVNYQSETDSKKQKNMIFAISKDIDAFVLDCYKKSTSAEGIKDSDVFWIQFFEEKVLNLFKNKRNINNWKFGKAYICDFLWDEWKSYIAMKFIDMGKAYYHFSTPDLYNINADSIYDFSKINPSYEDGLTSFDYEYIKAKESLDRTIATRITYASGVFSNAMFDAEYKMEKGQEDVLQYKEKDIKDSIKEDAKRKFLQYFGGQSSFTEEETNGLDDIELASSVINLINVLRNNNFHYATKPAEADSKAVEVAKMLFNHEYNKIGAIYSKKYFSNNIPLFYKKDDINNFIKELYSERVKREPQVPAFGNVVKRKEVENIIKEYVGAIPSLSTTDGSLEKFRAAFYFVLKEIYYYGFLKQKDLKERFLNAVDEIINDKNALKNKDAYNDYKNRINEFLKNKEVTFGEICQGIMTDYNLQNQIKEVYGKANDEEKYKHFRMLLYVSIKKAFLAYLKETNNYDFLKKPAYYKEEFGLLNENFISPEIKIYSHIAENMSEDVSLYTWYIIAHFLSPKQLNLLQGDIKNYAQFVSDIENRARSNGKTINVSQDMLSHNDRIVEVLEFAMIFAGQITNNIEDYFSDQDEYAKYLSNYVHFVNKKDPATAQALKIFSETPISRTSDTKIGFYCDEVNPIVNRSVIISSMFGLDTIISGAFKKDKIEPKEFEDYYKLKEKLVSVFNKGKASNEEEQKDLIRFQQIKNRLELGNIAIYSEVLVDLLSELVSWSYLRERDLLFYQLGYYYVKLFYTDSVPSDSYLRKLDGKDIHIEDGAVLYQIIAMYAHDLIVYSKKGEATYKKGQSAGASISKFMKLYCEEDGAAIYMAGLKLFENTKNHDDYVKLRNEIDHMKYLSNPTKSILNLYRDIYNGFFDYDIKLKKSVTFILKNIFARYFVITDLKINKTAVAGTNYCMASFVIDKDKTKSEVFTYKDIKVKKFIGKIEKICSLELPCRSDKFIDILLRVVDYKL